LAEENDARHMLRLGHGAGVARPEQLEGKPGLQIMTEMMTGVLPYAVCAESLQYCAIKVEHGYSLFQGTTMHSQLNPMGTIHGGWMSSILDSAIGCAVFSSLPAGHVYSTTVLEVRYLKFLTLKVPRVRVEAKLTRIKERDAFAEACMYGPDDTVYAEATATCRLAVKPGGH
jgi:uncharacterized protein (TIGR00369 family)